MGLASKSPLIVPDRRRKKDTSKMLTLTRRVLTGSAKSQSIHPVSNPRADLGAAADNMHSWLPLARGHSGLLEIARRGACRLRAMAPDSAKRSQFARVWRRPNKAAQAYTRDKSFSRQRTLRSRGSPRGLGDFDLVVVPLHRSRGAAGFGFAQGQRHEFPLAAALGALLFHRRARDRCRRCRGCWLSHCRRVARRGFG